MSRLSENKWSDSKWIVSEVAKKWSSGQILRELIGPAGLFPMRLVLKRPDNREINENFARVSDWIKQLREQDKQSLGFGYELSEREINSRQSGRNLVPTHAVVATVRDALLLLGKKREADKFLNFTGLILSKWPGLLEWVKKYPLRVMALYEDWDRISAVLHWFLSHPRCGLYLRQLDIEGVDTKFIEQRKPVITELLNIILPQNAVSPEFKEFEPRFGLRWEPVRIRLRLLDPVLYVNGLSDIEIPVEELKIFDPKVRRVFITENKMNGLCFPDAASSLVIFGLGYGVNVLGAVDWLKNKEIYYWGDIDTHGFAILDRVRQFLPQTKSMLMTEEVLALYRDMWSFEEKPYTGEPLTRLTPEEYRLFCALTGNIWGMGVRLEQERIPFHEVTDMVCTRQSNLSSQ